MISAVNNRLFRNGGGILLCVSIYIGILLPCKVYALEFEYIDGLERISPRDMAVLPVYCPRTGNGWKALPQDSDLPPRSYYESLLGARNFNHLHHYCQGLAYLGRLRRTVGPKESTKRLYWDHALKEFNYVLNSTDAQFVLRPEVLTRRGEVLIGLGDLRVAIKSFEDALVQKRDYWPASVGLAKSLIAIGDRTRANQVVAASLEHSPRVPALLELRSELSSTQPHPKPK